MENPHENKRNLIFTTLPNRYQTNSFSTPFKKYSASSKTEESELIRCYACFEDKPSEDFSEFPAYQCTVKHNACFDCASKSLLKYTRCPMCQKPRRKSTRPLLKLI